MVKGRSPAEGPVRLRSVALPAGRLAMGNQPRGPVREAAPRLRQPGDLPDRPQSALPPGVPRHHRWPRQHGRVLPPDDHRLPGRPGLGPRYRLGQPERRDAPSLACFLLIGSGGRSGPRASRAWIRQVPVSRSCSSGPHRMLSPRCRPPSSSVRCHCSSAATQVSSGTSTIRRNNGHPGPGPMPALMLASSPGERLGPAPVPSRLAPIRGRAMAAG